MGVKEAEPRHLGFYLILLPITIGITEEEELRAMRHITAILIRIDTLRQCQPLRPNVERSRGGLRRVIENQDLIITPLLEGVVVMDLLYPRILISELRVLHHLQSHPKPDPRHGIQWIHLGRLRPETPRIIEGKVDRVNHTMFF